VGEGKAEERQEAWGGRLERVFVLDGGLVMGNWDVWNGARREGERRKTAHTQHSSPHPEPDQPPPAPPPLPPLPPQFGDASAPESTAANRPIVDSFILISFPIAVSKYRPTRACVDE
jgi:hypothetical protein